MTEILPFTNGLTITRALVPLQVVTAQSTPPSEGPWNKMIAVSLKNVADPTKQTGGTGVRIEMGIPETFPAGDYEIVITSPVEGTVGTLEIGDAP
jgi:hypothetical protein